MSLCNGKRIQKIPKIKNTKDIEHYISYYNTEANTNTNINSFSTNMNKYIDNKKILLETGTETSDYNENEKNNESDYENPSYNDSPTNIDEIIKNQMSSAIIDSFLNQHQIKSVPMFILYLSEIWQGLTKEVHSLDNKVNGINLFAFNKYYNLPGLIGQRLFNILDSDNNGSLSPKEFITGMSTIFCEEIDSLIQFIFNFYDFDGDEFITFDDVHAVLSYLPVINGFDDMIDIEEEICSTIQDIFITRKEKIDYNTFQDLIIRKERYELFIPLISFLYDNKPFNNEEINEFYIGYYNAGKFNDNEGNYQIPNIIKLKEIETKIESQINAKDNYKSTYRDKTPNRKHFSLTAFENNLIKECMRENKSEININIYGNKFYNKKNGEIKNLSKEDYKKFILNSNGFENMRKSIPLLIGNSNILNEENGLKTINSKYLRNSKENKLGFKTLLSKNLKKKNRRENSMIYSFCKNRIKSNCMTFNNKIDDETEEFDGDSLQKSMTLKINNNYNNNLIETSWKNNNINNKRIKYESYLYKITKKGKFKKIYFKLSNQDLYYYKNENSKIHKGMHNLSTYFLEIRPKFINNLNKSDNKEISNINNENLKYHAYTQIINGIEYFCFMLINIKGQIHHYYTPDLNIYEEWVDKLKIILRYKNIYEQYIFKEIIGKGKNCIVFFAYDTINHRNVAIKRIKKAFLTLEDLSLIQTEIDTLKVCQHPYVVKLYEIIETFDEVNLILEYCDLGNLYYYLSQLKFNLSEEEIATYIHDISKAVYSMHNLGIIHRDLKLSNIALTKNKNKVEIRILDFGLSKILGPNQLCNEGYGTPGYAAPEVINRNNYSYGADVWSIGVIAFFLCTGKLPFDYSRPGCTEKDLIENTLLDEVKFDNNFSNKYSIYAMRFIKNLMNKNTFERPNIREVLQHEWFQKFFKSEVKKRKINNYKNEFYENPNIEEIVTLDENFDKEKTIENRNNFLLYTSINNNK